MKPASRTIWLLCDYKKRTCLCRCVFCVPDGDEPPGLRLLCGLKRSDKAKRKSAGPVAPEGTGEENLCAFSANPGLTKVE